jgi:hypothetical protein
MSGKSCWVHLSTQGSILPYCRWSVVSWLQCYLSLPCWRYLVKCLWAQLIFYISHLCFCLEDVIEASSVFQMYWFVIISNYVILTYQIWNLILYNLFMNSVSNIISVVISMYVICIRLIKYDLSCNVDYRGLSWHSTRDENGTDIFRPYSRPNPFREVQIRPYPSPDI